MLAESFSELNLDPSLVEAAAAQGLVGPSELQERLLPLLQSGAHVRLRAGQESGQKTGYLLPLMQRLLDTTPQEGKSPRALILCPDREQAMALGRTLKALGNDSPLRFGTVVGGRPYPMQHQLLRRPLDILVATPTRLADHMRRGHVPFDRLRLLVLDEADEMLDSAMEADLEFILEATAGGVEQTLLRYRHSTPALERLSARLQPAAQSIEMPVAEEEDARMPPDLHESRKARRGPRRRTPFGRVAATSHKSGNAKGKGKVAHGKANASGRQSGKSAAATVKNRAPGRRNGPHRRQPAVRFPSDHANAGRPPAPPGEAVEQHREVKRHEPQQYLADYGFASSPRTRRPVTIIYRNKSRKPIHGDEEAGGKDDA